MAEGMLAARSALDGIAVPGRHGARSGPPGLLLQERAGVEIVGLAARRGREAAVAEAVRRDWDVPLPSSPRMAGGDGAAFLWSGAGQWLVLAGAPAVSAVAPPSLEERLRRACGADASLTAQGDGRVVLQLGGPGVREVLASLVPIDLHPRAFRLHDTAMTLLNHVGVQLTQIDDTPRFELLAFRGYAASILDTVLDAGLRFGVEVLPPA